MKKIILSIIFSLCIIQTPLLIHAWESDNNHNPFNKFVKEEQATRNEIIREFYNECDQVIYYYSNDIRFALVRIQVKITVCNNRLRSYGYVQLTEYEIDRVLDKIRSALPNQ